MTGAQLPLFDFPEPPSPTGAQASTADAPRSSGAFAALADKLTDGEAWFWMDNASGEWRAAVAACILQRENDHE